jgi:hypothetical protein
MASSGVPQTISWVKTGKPSSGPFAKVYPEKAAMSAVKKGDPVILDSAGRIGSAADSGSVFGIADQDFSGTTDTPMKVTVVGHEDILRASQSNAGATQASTQAMVGLRCSYIKSTITGQTAKMTVDTADTGTPSVEIVDLRDPVGTQDGEVYFRFVQGLISAR